MNLNDIHPAVAAINANNNIGLRAETYLRTYPSIVRLGAQPPSLSQLHLICCTVYGWMPRIVRINPDHVRLACEALALAQAATQANWQQVGIADLTNCIYSVVGASKVLHFTNPGVFPIWDSNVERFRLQSHALPYNHMTNIANYVAYVQEVYAILAHPDFQEFFEHMTAALNQRLGRLNIPGYNVTLVRAVEMAAFELAV